MKIKSRPQNSACPQSVSSRRFAAFVFLLTLAGAGLTPLWAQDPGMESRVIRLSWTKDDYALRYEVIVEKEENGIYRNVHREFTQAFSVEISLPEGNYRCSVIPYDFLGRPGERSEWISMEVRALLEPEPPETETEEMPETETEELPEIVEPPEIVEIIIGPPIRARKKMLVDKYFGIAWMPVVPAHSTSEDQFLNKNPSLSGVGTRLGFVSAKQRVFSPGLELAVSGWNGFFKDVSDQYISDPGITDYYITHYKTNLLSLAFDLNFVMQKYFSNRTFILSLQAGGGITFLSMLGWYTANFGESEEFFFDSGLKYYPQATLGVSLIWLPRGSFYVETGLDYSYLFSQNNFGYLRPRLGLGTRY